MGGEYIVRCEVRGRVETDTTLLRRASGAGIEGPRFLGMGRRLLSVLLVAALRAFED